MPIKTSDPWQQSRYINQAHIIKIMASTAQQSPSSRQLPERIGRFVTERELGRGAQGVVYLAKDSELDRIVAIKTLSRKRQDSNLVQEARNVSNLQHPNIVQLYEIGLSEDTPYLVYQYFDGESLKKRLEQSRAIKALDAVRIICLILDGLSYAHKNGIVHRDINPSNILINKNNELKIMDFGISESIGTATSTNEIAGTINYLAPELLSGKSVDGPVDIFSAGLMLHELLTGQMVFKAENHMAVMYKISHENILPPSKFNKNIDSSLDSIVMRSLERDLNQRYKNADEMRQDLDNYLQSFEEEEEVEITESGKTNSTLDFLMRKMQRKQDFPAVSSHISEINQKSSIKGMSSANELSNVILEDYALTTKLLRLVNSSFYGQFGGEITTVSRGIIILGYEQVRAAALSIILFEHLKNDQQANELKLETCSALMSAIIAREQAKHLRLNNEDDIETAFIASMFHELGKLLTIYYFPEEYNEIKNLIETQGLEEEKAIRSILGIPYNELGKGIASEWKLPEVISNSMDKLPEGEIKPTKKPDEIIRQVTCFANELCAIGRLGEDRDEALKELEKRYQSCMKVDRDKIEKLINDSKHELKEFTRILNLDTSNVSLFSDLSATTSPVSTDADQINEGTTSAAAGQHNARQDLIINGITEVTNAMLGDFDLNSVLTMILETIYRGMGFNRVLFCLRDNKSSVLLGRFGYGKSINDLIPKFRLPIKKGSDDVIHDACQKGKDFIIIDVNSDEYKSRVPESLRKLTSPRSLVLYPIVVNKRVLGLIYADMSDATTEVSMDALKFFKTLRNQAALAIQQKQAK